LAAGYADQEDQPGGPKVVVLTYELWTDRFARDPGIIGRKLILNGEPTEVIGVMPNSFNHRRALMFAPLQPRLICPRARPAASIR